MGGGGESVAAIYLCIYIFCFCGGGGMEKLSFLNILNLSIYISDFCIYSDASEETSDAITNILSICLEEYVLSRIDIINFTLFLLQGRRGCSHPSSQTV